MSELARLIYYSILQSKSKEQVSYLVLGVFFDKLADYWKDPKWNEETNSPHSHIKFHISFLILALYELPVEQAWENEPDGISSHWANNIEYTFNITHYNGNSDGHCIQDQGKYVEKLICLSLSLSPVISLNVGGDLLDMVIEFRPYLSFFGSQGDQLDNADEIVASAEEHDRKGEENRDEEADIHPEIEHITDVLSFKNKEEISFDFVAVERIADIAYNQVEEGAAANSCDGGFAHFGITAILQT